MSNYNPYYPTYQQAYQPYQQMYPTYQQGYPQSNQYQQTEPKIQDGGFVVVSNIEEARNYHVEIGKSVTFKDENAPYIYTKTRGFSQLEKPTFEVYRLVKEEDMPQKPQNALSGVSNDLMVENMDYALKSDIEALRSVYDDLKGKVDKLVSELGGDHE